MTARCPIRLLSLFVILQANCRLGKVSPVHHRVPVLRGIALRRPRTTKLSRVEDEPATQAAAVYEAVWGCEGGAGRTWRPARAQRRARS